MFDTDARGLRVCSGGEWIIAGGTPSTNPVFGGANGDGINAVDAGASCATIKFDFPSSTSGAYWIDPRGEGPYRAWCDMETLGGGWTLVAKIQDNNPFMNRRNTAQWRDRTYVGDPDSLSAVNTLAQTYEDVPFTDVLVLGVDDTERFMAWRHPNLYPDMFSVVDAGQRISDGVLIGGSVQNLSYPSYPRTDRYNGCRALKYGFFGYDDNQLHTGIAGHTGMLAGHAGGVVAASLFYDGHTVTPPVTLVDNACISDWAFGGGYSTGTSGDDAYGINAHWWGDGNTTTNTWFTHALLVRHNPGDNDDGLATGAITSPGRSCKQINDLHGPGLDSRTYWLESADGATRYEAYCDMSTEGGGWTLVSKLRGNTPALSRAQHSAWREREYIGDIGDIQVEDALGPSYEHVEFTDVMLMGINNPGRRTGWRHPTTYPSVYSIVDAGTRVSDGGLLFGNFTTLDYGSNTNINPCSGLKYGFLGYDDNQFNTGSFVGHNIPNGHAGGIVSISVFRDSNGTGADNSCITDFGFGGGYSTNVNGDDTYNINAHWWGNGNAGSHNWNPMAFFVR